MERVGTYDLRCPQTRSMTDSPFDAERVRIRSLVSMILPLDDRDDLESREGAIRPSPKMPYTML